MREAYEKPSFSVLEFPLNFEPGEFNENLNFMAFSGVVHWTNYCSLQNFLIRRTLSLNQIFKPTINISGDYCEFL